MPTIKQYRPSYFTGFEKSTSEFNSIEELLNIPWIKNFSEWPKNVISPNFYRFSLAENHVLMAEYDSGKTYFVVGYFIDDEQTNEMIKQLPVWVDEDKCKENEDGKDK